MGDKILTVEAGGPSSSARRTVPAVGITLNPVAQDQERLEDPLAR
jgi:hypothetical protein